MDVSPYPLSSSSPLAALPDFVSAAERGFRSIGRFTFLTGITERADVERYVVDCLDDIDVTFTGAGWGEDGLMIDFSNHQDLTLFSLAFRGPRVR